MDIKAAKERIEVVRKKLSENNISGLIVTKPANVSYITGFSGYDSWAVVTPLDVYLLTDNRYTEQAQSQCLNCKIIERSNSLSGTAYTLLARLKSVETIAVESTIELAEWKALKKHFSSKLKVTTNIIESVRIVKDDGEVSTIRKTVRLAHKSLEAAVLQIKAGLSENELAGVLDFEIRKIGGKSCFDTIVAFGSNSSRAHHQPGNRRLRKNDTVLIDFGVKFDNYCCDLTRCFVVGKTRALYRKVYDIVLEAQKAAIKKIKMDAEIEQIDAAARKVIARNNLPVYGHGTGHGLGLEVHEEPVIGSKNKEKLLEGMVFTIEPAVYIPGKLGVRIEDNVLVTRKGCKVLSRSCPNKLLELN